MASAITSARLALTMSPSSSMPVTVPRKTPPKNSGHIEPDHLDETLVCYDSRTDGSWDLADKELAKLIAEVAEKNPHIVVIMDCCHSGSGTRGSLDSTVAVRRAPMDKRQRPLSSFIVAPVNFPPDDTTTRSESSHQWVANSPGTACAAGRLS
jgi:hypothetical protein